MPVTQTVDRAFASEIGEGGVPDELFGRALERTAASLGWLRQAYEERTLPLLRLPESADDLAGVRQCAERMRKGATDIVVLGTGGSSLGGQALAQLAGYGVPGLGALRPPPRLHFLDNLDPFTLQALLEALPIATTRFVAISKSGGTGETLVQTMAVLKALDLAEVEDIGERFLGLSEPEGSKPNGLRDLLDPLGAPFLDHHTGIGGRFSVLSNVGLLPAAISGLDLGAIRAGAAEALAPVLAGSAPGAVSGAVGAALSAAAAEAGKPITVMMAYADRLERFSAWWVQLWSESLGKDGRGTTPVRALGPVDQHSQLQLHLAGPRDKLFTVVTVDVAGTGPELDPTLARRAGEPGFGGRTVGDLVAAQGRATADTLARNGRPVRLLKIDRLDERALGHLLMHFMLETIVVAHLLGVDPFDQPAVEEGKLLAKKYLTEG